MKDKPQLLPRYLLRLEDEINELVLLYIARAVAQIHINNFRGVFQLIVIAMITIAAANLAPNGALADWIIFNLCCVVMVFAILELLLLLSFVQQAGREETDVDATERASTAVAEATASHGLNTSGEPSDKSPA